MEKAVALQRHFRLLTSIFLSIFKPVCRCRVRVVRDAHIAIIQVLGSYIFNGGSGRKSVLGKSYASGLEVLADGLMLNGIKPVFFKELIQIPGGFCLSPDIGKKLFEKLDNIAGLFIC